MTKVKYVGPRRDFINMSDCALERPGKKRVERVVGAFKKELQQKYTVLFKKNSKIYISEVNALTF